jgi:hypothetical protein
MGELLLIVFGVVIYFVPSFWAMGKRNSGAIFALNLFLGWTFIGWVGALIWAIMDKDDIKPVQPSNYDTKLSFCPYCEVDTKTYYQPVSGLADIRRCTECNGIKG